MKGRACSECPTLGPLNWVRIHGAKSPAAKPLNPEPDTERGNIRITVIGQREEGRVLSGNELIWAREQGEELWLSHFVTCPASERFRSMRRMAEKGEPA